MTRGPIPKPAGLRQRRNKKSGNSKLTVPDNPKVPMLPNPDKRKWHRLTSAWWKHVWQSPMASEYLETDIDGLSRVAILVDAYYNHPTKEVLAEIRLQEARFGLSPVDRSRLQWEVQKGEEAQRRRSLTEKPVSKNDPRGVLGIAK